MAMVRRAKIICVVMLLAWTRPGFAAKKHDVEPQIVVDVYNQAGVPTGTLTDAKRRAGAVFYRAGVDLKWEDCTGPYSEDLRECSGGTWHVDLHIVPRSRSLGEDAFGIAFIGLGYDGTQVDVFYENVTRFASDGKFASGEILGNVIAHEIGHLLLGSGSHTAWGIMRARWDQDELRRAVRGGAFFLPDQSRRMRKRAEMNRHADRELLSSAVY